jgi:hypothetical protein
MEGYVREYRKIILWQWYRDIAVAHLFRHLILCANYTTANWQGITVSRGQLVTSRQKLSYETGLTEKVVRRCLKVLEKTGEIQLQHANKYTLITICKYSEYQSDESAVGQQRANNGPAEGRQGSINKKRKKSKNVESSLCSDSMSAPKPTNPDEGIDYGAIMAFFNEKMACKNIPQIKVMTKKRQGALNSRIKEHGRDAVAVVIKNAADSSWLNGGGGKFVANFDWLFRPTNFIKVLEGNYNREINTNNRNNGIQNNSISSNSGRRSPEDIYCGAARVIACLEREAQQTQEEIPVI